MATDDLAEINGIRPSVLLADGERREAKSHTSSAIYVVKRTNDHYYWRSFVFALCCGFSTTPSSCPAWRNQKGAPVNARTCKHLKALLGDKYEHARIKMKNPDGSQAHSSSSSTKPSSRTRRAVGAGTQNVASVKRKNADDQDDEEDCDYENGSRPSKRPKRLIASSKKGKEKVEDEDRRDVQDDDDEDSPAPTKTIPALLLANKWDIETGPDPTGWWMSEKLDGVRTYYDGSQLISRLGNPFTPPNWFLDKLPKDVTLDGELYGGRGGFQSTVSIVKTVNSVHWRNISFQVFDIPSLNKPFEERYAALQGYFGQGGTHTTDQIEVVAHIMAQSRQHVLTKLKEVESLGGEGVMLRKAGSLYEGRRSASLLKIKTFYDAEAVVTGYAPGKGRNKGITGALMCKMESGKLFNVGSGLTDKIRKTPPAIGSIITYRFQELTRDGVPRFPSYVGVAVDKDQPKDAEIPAHRTGNTAVGTV